MKKIIQLIKDNHSFLITAHMNLEGDALGSELAMYKILKNLGKRAVVCNHDPSPENYSILPFIKKIKNNVPRKKFDVAFVLDCSDSSRTGKIKDYLGQAKKIVNIDHHISNTYFGDYNWVNPKASSACELIYELAKRIKVIDDDIALCLYTGILTDTGNFTYNNVNSRVHMIAADLLRYKIYPQRIYQHVHSSYLVKDLRFISSLIKKIQLDKSGKISWIKIRRWPKIVRSDLTETIFSIMRLLKDAEIFVLFKRLEKNKIRVNFRSRSRFDVNRIAKFFGGGGHPNASGTTIEDSLDNTEKKVIAFIKRYTNGHKK